MLPIIRQWTRDDLEGFDIERAKEMLCHLELRLAEMPKTSKRYQFLACKVDHLHAVLEFNQVPKVWKN